MISLHKRRTLCSFGHPTRSLLFSCPSIPPVIFKTAAGVPNLGHSTPTPSSVLIIQPSPYGINHNHSQVVWFFFPSKVYQDPLKDPCLCIKIILEIDLRATVLFPSNIQNGWYLVRKLFVMYECVLCILCVFFSLFCLSPVCHRSSVHYKAEKNTRQRTVCWCL